MTLSNIVMQLLPPESTTVLWIKPVEGGVALYVFNNGAWQALKIMDDSGTTTTDDDVVEDFNNLDNVVQEEVTKQIGNAGKGEVNTSDSTDEGEYPDIKISI